MEIRGKVAIVTGAAAGIGRATAVMLAELGAKGLLLADVDRDGLAVTAGRCREQGAEAVEAITDVTYVAPPQSMYRSADARFGRIDIVFNNAGIGSGPPPFPDTDLGRIKLVIDI